MRLEGGTSGRRELHLDGGRPHLPFAVGEHGDWKVQAALPGSHVMIAYNGSEVFIGALGSTEGIEINGAAAEPKWTSPDLPVVVAFGEARLVIDQQPSPEDPMEVTTSPVAHSVRFVGGEALTEVADEARLQAALAKARHDTQRDSGLQKAFMPTPPALRRVAPPPLPTRPKIRLITRPWDKS